MLKKKVYILFFIFICGLNCPIKALPLPKIDSAQNVSNNPQTWVIRKFKEDLNQKYNGNAFDYTKTQPRESLWSKFKRFIRKIVSKIFKTDGKTINKITEIILYLFSVLIVGGVLYYLMKVISTKQGNWFFSKKNKKVEIKNEDIIEDIHEIDFKATITNYELEKNYRAAFRYQFLSLLKTLTDSGKIQWTPEKTNWDYLSELKEPNEKKHFQRAVYLFDHVWYGDFKINEEEYKQFSAEVQPLKTSGNE